MPERVFGRVLGYGLTRSMGAFALGLLCGTLVVSRLTLPPASVFALQWPLGIALMLLPVGVLSWRCGVSRVLGHSLGCHRSSLLGTVCGPVMVALLAGSLVGALASVQSFRAAGERALDARLVGGDVRLVGRVADVPRHDGRRVSFDLLVERTLHVPDARPFAPRRLRLSLHRGRVADAVPRAGERWELTVRLRAPRGLRNAGSFDAVRHALVRRVDAQGYVRAAPAPRRLAAGGGVAALRERLAEAVRHVGESPVDGVATDQATALALALTLGLGHEVSETTRTLLRDSGTAHLLAISGLHVTLIAGWALWSTGALARRVGVERARAAAFACAASLALATAYAVLAGFGLPTRRALVMLAVVLVAGWRLRMLTPGSALAAALIAVLAIDPLAPLASGFWLSFGTVAALLWLHAGRGHGGETDGWRRIVPLLRTHCLLGLVLLPVSAWFFQSGSWIAPLANAVAVPFTAFIVVPLAFATLALAILWPAVAPLALTALAHAVEGLLGFLGALLACVDGVWTLALPSLETLLWALAGLAVLLAPRGLMPRRFAPLLLLPALWANLVPPAPKGFEVHVLDVGQGLAALVLTERETWLYDTGGPLTPSRTMLEAAVVPYLHTLGRRRVDTLVVSHPDSDHAAGLAAARALWPGVRVFAGARDANTPPEAIDCEAGRSERQSGVHFSFLHPAAHDRGSENDLSCVLLVHHGASRALLSGDIERAGERRLLARLDALPVTMMTAPHHGSRTSSGAALLRALAPAHVVFPAGADNRHGFPHAEVQMRYKAAGAVTYTTGHDGALRFAFGPEGLIGPPLSWRDRERRFWHDLLVSDPPEPERVLPVRAVSDRTGS